MAGAFKGSLQGGRELEASLRTLGEKTERKFLKRAVGMAGRPISKSAKSNVATMAENTGMLRQSIGVKNKFYRVSGSAVSIIGPRTNTSGKKRKAQGWTKKFDAEKQQPSKYAHLVEFGTKPHWIPCKNIGGRIIWNAWLHPGTPARPFLRKAFDSNKERSFEIMKESLRVDIAAEARKLARGK